MTDFQYQLIKYLGGVVAALYGVLATFTDFHEKKQGKKVLSKAGRYGLAILAVSSICSLSSDVLKDRMERKQKNEQATIEAAQRENAEKALDLFKYDLSIAFYIRIPVQQAPIRAYLDRLTSLQRVQRLPDDIAHIYIHENEEGYPSLQKTRSSLLRC
jgi:hypothetical protein